MTVGDGGMRSSEALLRDACFGVLSAKRDKVGELTAEVYHSATVVS